MSLRPRTASSQSIKPLFVSPELSSQPSSIIRNFPECQLKLVQMAGQHVGIHKIDTWYDSGHGYGDELPVRPTLSISYPWICILKLRELKQLFLFFSKMKVNRENFFSVHSQVRRAALQNSYRNVYCIVYYRKTCLNKIISSLLNRYFSYDNVMFRLSQDGGRASSSPRFRWQFSRLSFKLTGTLYLSLGNINESVMAG